MDKKKPARKTVTVVGKTKKGKDVKLTVVKKKGNVISNKKKSATAGMKKWKGAGKK